MNPIIDQGRFSGSVIAFTDVSHRKRAQEELSARYNELATLHEIGQMIFASTEVKTIFDDILERTLRLLAVDLGNLRLFDADGRMPVVAYRGYCKSENIGRYEGRGGTPVIGGFLRRVVASRQSAVVDDVLNSDGLQTFKSEGARSAIVVPITTADETLGVIEVASRMPRKFRPDEVRSLKAIGHQVGIALQKARLVEEAQRRAREQEALSAIARATSQTLNFDEMLQVSLDKVLEVTGREQGYIRLREPGGVNLRLAVHRGISSRYVESLVQHRRIGGKSEQVFRTGDSLVINDPESGDIRDEIRREGTRALVWVPLKVMGAIIGIMNVSTTRDAPFEPREVELLKAIGNVIGVALENARLFREAERRNHELKSLYTVASSASKLLDTHEVIDTALKTTIEIMGVDAGRFYVLDDKHGRLTLAAHYGIAEGELKSIQEYAIGEGVIGKIATEAHPIVFADIESDVSYASAARSGTGRRLGFRSAAGLPITVKGRTVGVVYVYGRLVRQFPSRDIDLLSAIGGQIGFALENSRLFSELSAKAAELERSNSELQHFAYIASHDLQEPLRMVASYMQLLSRRYKGKLDSDADEFIGFAVDGALRMQALINALLSYSRVGSQGKAFEPTDFEKVLDGTLAGLKKAIEESGAEISRDPLPTLMADGAQIGQLFQNLVGNALKFRDHRRPVVRVGATHREKEWLFSITDNGVGFDPKNADRIFVMFQRLHSKDEYPGTGIGLAVCKKIVERHGGRIWVDSARGEGSTFYFTLPD
jgi:GAF domain-containing protein